MSKFRVVIKHEDGHDVKLRPGSLAEKHLVLEVAKVAIRKLKAQHPLRLAGINAQILEVLLEAALEEVIFKAKGEVIPG